MLAQSWDEYFYKLAQAAASNSKCLSRQIGAVLAKGKFIVSTGYNGPPSHVKHCSERVEAYSTPSSTSTYPRCPRRALHYGSGEGLHLCPAAHAERNAIDIAARLGHSTEGCSLYLTWIIPCRECAKSIINAGITEVVVADLMDYEQDGITGLALMDEAGVLVRKYKIRELIRA